MFLTNNAIVLSEPLLSGVLSSSDESERHFLLFYTPSINILQHEQASTPFLQIPQSF